MRVQQGAATGRLVAAVDVGGTSIKAALVDDTGRIVAERRSTTPREGGPMAVVAAIETILRALIRDAPTRPVSAGVVVPGIVEESTGIARLSVNLGWRDLPLAARLSAAVGLPVALGHDVRAGALAELCLGAGRGATGMLFMPLGFGVAGAIVADGRLVTARGYAGEIGHIVVEPDGERCGCGQVGCLETVASAASVGRRYAQRAGLPSPVGAQEVAERVQAGSDPIAQLTWDQAVAALAGAITTINAILAPETVVIGGGLSLSGELLLAPVRAAVAARRTFLPLPRIVAAELGDRAGTLGAAMLARDLAHATGVR